MKHYSSDVSNRCTFRNKPVHAGSDVYLPACFSPEGLADNINPSPPVLSDEEKGEVRFQSFFLIIVHASTVALPPCVCVFFPFCLLGKLTVNAALRNMFRSPKYAHR